MTSPEKTTEHVQKVDRARASSDIAYACCLQAAGKGFISYADSFALVTGASPRINLLEERPGHQFAHEAGVYNKKKHSIFFTGNFATSDPIDLYSIHCDTKEIKKVDYDLVSDANANGACNYKDQVLYCCQGNRTTPSSLVLVDPTTASSSALLTNFHGREFNSINDVVVHHPSGDIWFTDPTYGWEQNFRPSPSLPSQVYRFRPATGDVVAVADGFVQCNGLCFSPDYRQLYVTDTGAVQAHGTPFNGHNLSFNPRLPSAIYVYDVVDLHGELRLANRRMFAHCSNGVPDGIKCDDKGNVYSGCGNGVHVWDPAGRLIGVISVGGTVANFCFSREGMWVFAEERLFLCELAAQGALVSIECG